MELTKLLHRTSGAWLLAAAMTLGAALGCTDDPAPTVPEDEPDPPTMTETFSGSFGQEGESEHTFTVVETGNITIEITELEPVSTLTVGIALGTYDESVDPPCIDFASDNRVVVGSTLVSSASPGEYCVSIRDVGNVFPGATVTYTLDVTHP